MIRPLFARTTRPTPRVLLVASAFVATLPVCAAASDPHAVQFTVDNDFFAGYDRHYTSGLQLAWLADHPYIHALPFAAGRATTLALAVGQRLYTPQNTDRDIPDRRDRPYAGWLYSMAEVRAASARWTDYLSISAGIAGPSALGRQTQDFAHRLFNDPLSRGWNEQIRARPTLMAGFERAWPGLATTRIAGTDIDLSPHVAANIGSPFTYAAVGAALRLGRNLPLDARVERIALAPLAWQGGTGRSPGWHLWAGVEARAVGYDLFVQGATFGARPEINRKSSGIDAQAGFVVTRSPFVVSFALVQRSREFAQQRAPDRFGQMSISLSY